MKLLLIDNYDSFTYNIVEVLRSLAIDDISIFKNDELSVDVASSFDKIIISPGPATPQESGEILPIIHSLGPTHSILGICLGHQAIAECYGAELINMDKPLHGFQTQLDIASTHTLFEGIEKDELTVGLYHSWLVNPLSLPEILTVTSYSTEGHIMSIKHKEFDVHGVQFHPESYMTPLGKNIMKNFLTS